MLKDLNELLQRSGLPGNMTHDEFLWEITAATFLAVVSISILALYFAKAVNLAWEWAKKAHLIADRRCCKRFKISLPVYVYGYRPDAEPFFEDTTVLQVSARGGLLTLASNVRVGQELLLTNFSSLELHQPCRVVRLGLSKGMKTEIGVRFARLAPDFWPMAKQS